MGGREKGRVKDEMISALPVVLLILTILLLPAAGRGDSLQRVGGWLVIDQNLMGKFVPASPPLARPTSGSFSGMVGEMAKDHGLSPELVQSVIRAESNGNARAVSPKGAMGLMQLMPETAKDYRVFDPFDPAANLRGGIQYLRDLLREFSGNVSLALAAYNAGPGAVHKYQGIPPFPETEAFVQKVKEEFQHGENSMKPSIPRRVDEMAPPTRIQGKIHVTGSPRALAAFLRRIGSEKLEASIQ